MMTNKAKEVLFLIAEAASKTSDQYVVCLKIPVENQDEAVRIRDGLENYGCISNAHIVGKYYIQCQFNVSALKYLN